MVGIGGRIAAMKEKQVAADAQKEEKLAAEKAGKLESLTNERDQAQQEYSAAEAAATEAAKGLEEAEAFKSEKGEDLDPEAAEEIKAIEVEAAEATKQFEDLKVRMAKIDEQIAALDGAPTAETTTAEESVAETAPTDQVEETPVVAEEAVVVEEKTPLAEAAVEKTPAESASQEQATPQLGEEYLVPFFGEKFTGLTDPTEIEKTVNSFSKEHGSVRAVELNLSEAAIGKLRQVEAGVGGKISSFVEKDFGKFIDGAERGATLKDKDPQKVKQLTDKYLAVMGREFEPAGDMTPKELQAQYKEIKRAKENFSALFSDAEDLAPDKLSAMVEATGTKLIDLAEAERAALQSNYDQKQQKEPEKYPGKQITAFDTSSFARNANLVRLIEEGDPSLADKYLQYAFDNINQELAGKTPEQNRNLLRSSSDHNRVFGPLKVIYGRLRDDQEIPPTVKGPLAELIPTLKAADAYTDPEYSGDRAYNSEQHISRFTTSEFIKINDPDRFTNPRKAEEQAKKVAAGLDALAA